MAAEILFCGFSYAIIMTLYFGAISIAVGDGCLSSRSSARLKLLAPVFPVVCVVFAVVGLTMLTAEAIKYTQALWREAIGDDHPSDVADDDQVMRESVAEVEDVLRGKP